MGIYYGVFNLSKREWFTGHEMESGAKWNESIHGPPASGLFTLLAVDSPDEWRGRWAGDVITITSDAGITWREAADMILVLRGEEATRDGSDGSDDEEIPGWMNIGERLFQYMVSEGDLPCVEPDPDPSRSAEIDGHIETYCSRCRWPLRWHFKLQGVVLREQSPVVSHG